MAFTTIAKASVHFDCPTWTGSDSTTTITGMGFKPDALLIKNYSGTGDAIFNNSTRGTAHNWRPNQSAGSDTTVYVASYTSDGFTLTGNLANTNDASDSYVGACWKANSGTTSSNSDGSITSTVQANTTSGVSVVTYTGTGSAGTIGHGLGVAPKLIMVKNTTQSDRGKMLCMGTTFVADPQTDSTEFAYTGAQADNTAFNDTAPTTSVFSVGTDAMTNQASQPLEAYCFAEVQGFSKIGFYSGTGNTQGTKVYCGFRPKWVLIKNIASSDDWAAKISGLTGYGLGGTRTRNVRYSSDTCQTTADIQFESNGFRCATTSTYCNQEDTKYVYLAFAEMPMVGTNGTVGLAF